MAASRDRRKQAGLPVSETALIVVTVILLLLMGAKRLENAAYLINEARAKNELQRIYRLEKDFLLQNQRFGYADDIRFNNRYPYNGVIFSIHLESSDFTAYAREAIGHDAFGDGRPGNEYFAIDKSGNIFGETFVE